MAKSKKTKPTQQPKNLQPEFVALQKSHRQLMIENQHHLDFGVHVAKKNLKRQIDRHELKPGQPMDAETLESMRDAHSIITLLHKALGGGGGNNGPIVH